MNKLPFTAFALMAVIFLASCGGGDDKAGKEGDQKPGVENNDQADILNDLQSAVDAVEDVMDDAVDAVEDVVVLDRSNNSECDEFLEGYENFMDNYITILKKSKADPADMSIMSEVMSLMTEASEWTSNTPDDCTDMEFIGKLSKIQLKMAAAASGM
jgi:hypothetical protein